MNYGKIFEEVAALKEDGASMVQILDIMEAKYKPRFVGKEWTIALDVILAAAGHYQMNNDPEELTSPQGIANFYRRIEEKPPVEPAALQ